MKEENNPKNIDFVSRRYNPRTKLEELDFDPIEKMVSMFKRLHKEDEYYLNVREADSIVELDNDGKTKRKRRYSNVAHTTVLSKMVDLSNDLLRYKYARVPETVDVTPNISPLNIIIKGKKDK